MPLIPAIRRPIQPSSIAKPPAPPRNLRPPIQRPPGNPNYGLPTRGAASKQPFDPFGLPKTQGQFNQEVNQAAQPSYLPQLQQNESDVSAENAANKQRSADISSIYSQYQSQAQQAFQNTQNALKQIIAQENAGNGQAGNVLGAALQSATAPGSATAAMMGLPTSQAATASEIAPYQATAGNATLGGQGYLGTLATSETANAGQAVTDAAIEQASQANTESQRHGAALQTLSSNKDAIVQQIPALVEKAREQMMTDLLNAQGIRFQENLAAKQFGLSKSAQDANISNARQTLQMNEQNSASNRANAAEQLRQNQEQLNINAQAVQEKAAADRAKLQQDLAKAQGKQQADAIKFLQGWVMPSKQEIVPAYKTTDPATGKVTVHPQGLVKGWHRDAGNALRTLMNTYGLSLQESLSLMSGITTPLGGGQPGTIGQWAQTFLQRAAQRTANGILQSGNRLVPVAPGLVKGRLGSAPAGMRG